MQIEKSLLQASFECAFRQACSVSRHTLQSACAHAVLLVLPNPNSTSAMARPRIVNSPGCTAQRVSSLVPSYGFHENIDIASRRGAVVGPRQTGPTGQQLKLRVVGSRLGTCPCAISSTYRVLRRAWTERPSHGEPAYPRAINLNAPGVACKRTISAVSETALHPHPSRFHAPLLGMRRADVRELRQDVGVGFQA